MLQWFRVWLPVNACMIRAPARSSSHVVGRSVAGSVFFVAALPGCKTHYCNDEDELGLQIALLQIAHIERGQ